MDCVACKELSREPDPVKAGLVEARVPDRSARGHVLLEGPQHHHGGRGVQHVVRRDVELIVHRLNCAWFPNMDATRWITFCIPILLTKRALMRKYIKGSLSIEL